MLSRRYLLGGGAAVAAATKAFAWRAAVRHRGHATSAAPLMLATEAMARLATESGSPLALDIR
ncbi:MAG: hypothetical protein JWP50_1278 [Phenylobacterium sp.]|nr:hypothetical protein [Phenylobacterium sp.]